MSGFMLRRFQDLVGLGVKTDKGFKEVHLNQVARNLSEFYGLDVSGTQLYNHLRKWHARWVRICKLKEISTTLWDEDNYTITMEEEHYASYIKDHPKDADYINKPIENYLPMQIMFGSGVATGRFAMGSNEPLTRPSKAIDVDADGGETAESADKSKGTQTTEPFNYNKCKPAESASTLGKRKRVTITEEEGTIMVGMTHAVHDMAAAVRESIHAEAAPGIYNAVMACPGFTREALMFALDHMMDNKATSLVFFAMSPEDRDLWLRTYLGKHYYKHYY